MKERFTYDQPTSPTATAFVGLSHRGCRVESHAAAAMRQPYADPFGIANLAINWGRIDTFGQGLAYFGIGAGAGALGAVTGGAAAGLLGTATTLSSSVASGAISGAVGGFSSGFVTGAGNAGIQTAALTTLRLSTW